LLAKQHKTWTPRASGREIGSTTDGEGERSEAAADRANKHLPLKQTSFALPHIQQTKHTNTTNERTKERNGERERMHVFVSVFL